MEKIIELCSSVHFQKIPPSKNELYPHYMPICNTSRYDCYNTLGEICEILEDEINERHRTFVERLEKEKEKHREQFIASFEMMLPDYLRKLKTNN